MVVTSPLTYTLLRFSRRFAPVIILFSGFILLLGLVVRFYLIPEMIIARHATAPERRLLGVHFRLVLALMLFILFCLMVMSYHITRRSRLLTTVRKPTNYPDAWKEAGRRLEAGGQD